MMVATFSKVDMKVQMKILLLNAICIWCNWKNYTHDQLYFFYVFYVAMMVIKSFRIECRTPHICINNVINVFPKSFISMYYGVLNFQIWKRTVTKIIKLNNHQHCKFEKQDEAKTFFIYLQIIVLTSSNMWLISYHKWDNTTTLIHRSFPSQNH
jgi:hypothetical protein